MQKVNGVEVRQGVGVPPGYYVGEDGSLWTRRVRVGAGPGGGKNNWSHVIKGPYRPLRGSTASDNYPMLVIRYQGKAKGYAVHLLVLRTFVGPKPESSPDGSRVEGCHKDGNSLNNHRSNLYWGSARTNKEDARKHGTMTRGESSNFTRLTEVQVRVIRESAEEGVKLSFLAKWFQVNVETIRAVVKRKTWKHVQ